jgi:hypothetical protein
MGIFTELQQNKKTLLNGYIFTIFSVITMKIILILMHCSFNQKQTKTDYLQISESMSTFERKKVNSSKVEVKNITC